MGSGSSETKRAFRRLYWVREAKYNMDDCRDRQRAAPFASRVLEQLTVFRHAATRRQDT